MTIWIDLGVNSARIWWVLGGLLVFGILYNRAIAYLEQKKYIEGFVSISVVLGVTITLLGVAVISWQAALLTLAGFAASGAPMVAGSIWRYVKARHAMQKSELEEAREDLWDEPTA